MWMVSGAVTGQSLRPMNVSVVSRLSASTDGAAALRMPRMLRAECRLGWLHLLALLVALARASPAHAVGAEDIRERLRVEQGATCLTSDRLAIEVARFLDGARIPTELAILVEGSATDPRSARLRVARRDQTVAERAFEPGPALCGHLHAAVALAIALAIKAEDHERGPARDWSLAGSGLWTYRLLPEFAPGVELSVRRGLGAHALLRVGAVGVAAFDVTLAREAGSFDAVLFAGRADGCGRAKLAAAVHAGACAGIQGGALHVAGAGVARPTSSVVPWVALSGTADFELELSTRWSFALALSATVLLHRVEVGLTGTPAARGTLPRAAFALGLGAVYYL